MTWLNTLAAQWWSVFALHMIEIALFLLLIAGVERVLKLNVTTRYALWLLGLAKIFVPPVIALPATFTASMPATFILPSFVATSTDLSRELPTMSTRALLFGLWLLSAFLFFGLMIKRHVHLRHRLQSATALAPFSSINCAAFETEAITSPVLIGLFNPKLYLPREWREWSPQHLHSILQHEAAHMQSRDLYTLALESFALVLFGLNPLVWLMRRRLTYLRELRCDFAALARTGISALDYSKLLYTFAEKQSLPSPAWATGITFAAQQSTLYQRLQHLLTRKESDMNTNRFGRFILLGIMGLALLAFSWQCSGSKLMDKAPLAPEGQSPAAAVQAETDAPPQVVSFVGPNYPEAAKQAQVQGMVFVQMTLDAEGHVSDAKVVKSRKMTEAGAEEVAALGYGLEEAALTAARGAKFKPAMQGGKPMQVTITMPYNFKLDNNTGAQLPKQEASASAQSFQLFDQAPEMLSTFELEYPEPVRKAGIEGTTHLEIGVSATGETETVAVKKSSGNENLDQSAIAAARAMKWKPAHYKGKPVAAQVVLPARFKLSE